MNSKNTSDSRFHALFPYVGAALAGFLYWIKFGWYEAILWIPITPIHVTLLMCCFLSLLGLLGYLLKFIVNFNNLPAFFAGQWNVSGILCQILSGTLPLALWLALAARNG